MSRIGLEYLFEFWNWVYCLIYFFNIAVMYNDVYGNADDVERDFGAKLASINVILLWVGLFYWLRLFDSFSMYIHLILSTVRSILPFMILFVIVLLCFANGLFILDVKTERYEYEWD